MLSTGMPILLFKDIYARELRTNKKSWEEPAPTVLDTTRTAYKTALPTILLLLRVKKSICGLVVRVLATDPEARVRFPALPDFL
jgi:hypothetical protein